MRKLLIISTTFYPDPQVPAIRMTQWCRHLPKLGWRPHVLCRYYGYEATPEELAANVHPDVTLEYLDKPEAADGRGSAGGAFRNFVRTSINPMLLSQPGISSLFVPDPSIRFWRRRRQQILQRVKAIQPDVILTTSPPHSNHDIGLWLAAQTGIPWVADFRDPYLLDNRFRPSGLGLLRWHAHERFKEAVYRRAWLITHAIPNQARWTRRHLPFARERLLTLTNAFPLEMLEGLEAPRPTANARKTVLVTGTIPEPEQLRLAQAVAQLAAEGQDVQLTLLGRRPGHEAELGRTLGERLVLPGYVSHAESVRAVMQADVLVNFLDAFRSQSRLLSTKLFEYLASGNPVVCLNPSRVDRLLLWRMSGVKVVSGPSQEQLVSALREALAGKLRRSPGDVENFRREFNWPHRAGQLVAALNQLVAFPPQNVPPAESVVAPPAASVVITTRNRKQLLRQPLLSALHQSVPVEVIVIDDGSTDGTAEFVRRKFPQVRLVRHEQSRGYIVRRSEAASLASAAVIFSIDDDAMFSSPRVVEDTLREFDHPRIGAVAIPYIDVRKNLTIRQRSPSAKGRFVTSTYIGTAHAVRRDAFLQLGGYCDDLVHQGEEIDFCLRLLNHGWVVRLGQAPPIYHYESPQRDFSRMDFYGRRNDVLFAWHNVPAAMLPVHLAATTANGIVAGVTTGHPLRMLRGTVAGYAACARHFRDRHPVSPDTYWLHRRLKKRGPAPLEEIEPLLPPLPSDPRV